MSVLTFVIFDHAGLQVREFSALEIKNATDSFMTVVGKGGFGTVYKGSYRHTDTF